MEFQYIPSLDHLFCKGQLLADIRVSNRDYLLVTGVYMCKNVAFIQHFRMFNILVLIPVCQPMRLM